jgi:hypothetical protein
MGPASIVAKPSPRKASPTKLSPAKVKQTAKDELVPIRKIFATKSTLMPLSNQPTPTSTKSTDIARSPPGTKPLQSSSSSLDEDVLIPAVKASKASGDQQPRHPAHSQEDNLAQPKLNHQKISSMPHRVKVSSRPVNDDDDDDEAHSDRPLWYPLARAAP